MGYADLSALAFETSIVSKEVIRRSALNQESSEGLKPLSEALAATSCTFSLKVLPLKISRFQRRTLQWRGFLAVGLVFLWFLCGLISGIVGSNKGREGCVWFLVGILLGPFGIILALVVSPDRKGLEERSVAFGDHEQCDGSGSRISVEPLLTFGVRLTTGNGIA